MPNTDIHFHVDQDPLTVEVTSGHATLGDFRLMLIKKSDGAVQEFGASPKQLGDAIRDLFVIPVPPAELHQFILAIPGKYMPGPGQSVIDVTYEFVQEGAVLEDAASIEEPATQPIMRFHHRFFFKPIPAAAPAASSPQV